MFNIDNKAAKLFYYIEHPQWAVDMASLGRSKSFPKPSVPFVLPAIRTHPNLGTILLTQLGSAE